MIKVIIKREHLPPSMSTYISGTLPPELVTPTRAYPIHQNLPDRVSILIDDQQTLEDLRPLLESQVTFRVRPHQMPQVLNTKHLVQST